MSPSETESINVPPPGVAHMRPHGVLTYAVELQAVEVFPQPDGRRTLVVRGFGREMSITLDAAVAAHLAALLTR